MKNDSASSLLVLLVVLSGGANAVSAQCRVGDMMMLEGQKTGFLGHTCTGESAFTGTEGVCTSDGTIMQQTYEGSCSGSTPYCVQCRNPGEKGAALCLSDPDNAPSSCTFKSENRELLSDPTAPEGCLVGDIMYLDGDSVGVIGETCTGEASYTGTKSTCRSGQVVEEPYEGTCASFCVQCGSPGDRGAALCLSSPEVPEHCASAAEGQRKDPVQDPAAASGGGCLVGDIMYQNGDSVGNIGMVCVSSTEYSGAQSTCINGEVVSTPYEGECGQGFCVQCGNPGTWGAALCLDSPEVPERCDTFVGNGDNPGATEGCLVGDIMYQHGDNIGFIGETCTGESAFIGTESFCENGQVVRKPYSGSCEGSVPFCVQCGQPGEWGAALCLSEQTQPSGCSFEEASVGGQQPQGDVPRGPSMDPIVDPILDDPLEEPTLDEPTLDDDPSGASLIVGECDFSSAWGSIYAQGDAVGVSMLTCDSDGKGYVGAETVCRDGQLVSQPISGACGEGLYCVQCESPGGSGNPWGGASATCSSSKDDVPEHCNSSIGGVDLPEGFLDDNSGASQLRKPMDVLGMSLAAAAAATAAWFMQL